MKIAVDAMGGDNAPDVVVQGAAQAASEIGSEITLVGDSEAIERYLASYPGGGTVSIHHCGEVVHMDELPLKAIRRKKDASIRVAFELVKKGEADAVISAGNSGAAMAAAILTLGRIKGIERPAFTSIFPGDRGRVILLDVGANVDCRPKHLLQFGIMAHAFATSCLGMDKPKIGLLSIGEEGGKGNEQVRQAHDLLLKSPLNFIGNIEGSDIFSGDVQIVVCDGFVGNVALKLSEGLAEAIARMLKQEFMNSIAGRVGFFLARRGFEKLKGKLDYAEYGGAPILGIRGAGIVCHGGSSPKAIKNAIKMAEGYAAKSIQHKLLKEISRLQDSVV